MKLDSDILDVGCGCGRFAATIAGHPHWGSTYSGRYTGIDVDREMIEWNRAHFAPEQFDFICATDHSSVYNPDAPRDVDPEDLRWPLDDATQDFAFSISLLTHLLADDVERICRETHRVLRPGAPMQMTVLVIAPVLRRLSASNWMVTTRSSSETGSHGSNGSALRRTSVSATPKSTSWNASMSMGPRAVPTRQIWPVNGSEPGAKKSAGIAGEPGTPKDWHAFPCAGEDHASTRGPGVHSTGPSSTSHSSGCRMTCTKIPPPKPKDILS